MEAPLRTTEKLHSEIGPFEKDMAPAPMQPAEADRHAMAARGVMAVGAVWIVAGAIVVAIVMLAASMLRV
jgi:hypothetical protein